MDEQKPPASSPYPPQAPSAPVVPADPSSEVPVEPHGFYSPTPPVQPPVFSTPPAIQPQSPVQPASPPFQPTPLSQPLVASSSPQYQQPPAENFPPQPVSPPPPGTPPLSQLAGGASPPPISGKKGLMVKIGLGISGFLVFLLLFSFVILPLFNGGGKQKDVTITFWGLWEDTPVMTPIIQEFEKQNPHIRVQYIRQDVKQYRDRLSVRTKNGTGPDVFAFHNTWVPLLSDVLLPLPSDVISPSDLKSLYYPVIQSDLTKNGAIYGIPEGVDTLSLFTNTDMFAAASQKVPAIWDDFMKTARALTVKDVNGKIKTAGAALGTYDNIDHASDIVSLLIVQNGGDLKKISATAQNTSEALQFYTSFAKDQDNVWDDTLDSSRLAFSKGNLAMFFGYSWDIFTIRSTNPQLNFTIHPVPSLPGRGMSIASYWAEGVSSKSKVSREALVFLKYLTQKSTVEKIYTAAAKERMFGVPYARTDLAVSLKANPLVAPFITQAPQAVSTYFSSDTYDNALNSQLNAYLGNTVRSILGDTSTQTAVDTLAQGVDQVLGQYGIK